MKLKRNQSLDEQMVEELEAANVLNRCAECATQFKAEIKELEDKLASCQQEHDQMARELWDEVICPMCYRLNPHHATADNGIGCHWCQDKEDWTGQTMEESLKAKRLGGKE